jgi:hypothetical protein
MPRLIFFQIAVFISAFLLFSVQLITAKELLPLFGGSVMIWGTCMIYFQGLLLGGYAFAHWSKIKKPISSIARPTWDRYLAYSPTRLQ